MTEQPKFIPAQCSAITPVLVVNNASQAIDFYKSAFGAVELMRLTGPGQKIVHAELKLAGAMIMVTDEFPEWGDTGPSGVSPVRIALYVENVDETTKRAVSAGAKIIIPVADQFYGDRSGRIADPYGHLWIIATHREDVSAAEMQRRMNNALTS